MRESWQAGRALARLFSTGAEMAAQAEEGSEAEPDAELGLKKEDSGAGKPGP